MGLLCKLNVSLNLAVQNPSNGKIIEFRFLGHDKKQSIFAINQNIKWVNVGWQVDVQ